MRTSSIVFAVLFLGTIAVESAPNKIPSYIEVCKRNDPHLEDCILNSVERLRPKLLQGIPELSVPSLDPLLIPEIKVSIGDRNVNGFRAEGHDVLVYGASNFKVNKLKVDLPNLKINVGIDLPELYFIANYDVDARFALLPVKGRGPIHCNATDIKGDVLLIGKLVDKEGEQYLTFSSIEVDLQIGDFHVHIENLFRGDTILTEATNAAINANSKEFLQSFLPVVERTTGNVILEIANKITKNFSYDELLPKE